MGHQNEVQFDEITSDSGLPFTAATAQQIGQKVGEGRIHFFSVFAVATFTRLNFLRRELLLHLFFAQDAKRSHFASLQIKDLYRNKLAQWFK